MNTQQAIVRKIEPSRVTMRARVPVRLESGVTVDFVSFHGLADGKEHLAIIFPGAKDIPAPLVRIHSECLTGDVFHSARCDCGKQLEEAMNGMSQSGGILLYLRQEGRGIGLYNKLDAYMLQIEQGLDTFESNQQLHFPDDLRDYSVAVHMLEALDVATIRLLTNNPDKAEQLRTHGITVSEILPTQTYMTAENKDYLEAKKNKTKHTLD